MKKIFVFTCCVAMIVAFSLPVAAVELSPEKAKGIPASFGTVKDGKIVYGNNPTAYSPDTWDAILKAYGFELKPDAVKGVPPTYAQAKDGKVTFGKSPTAYSPADYDKIFNAYGLSLSPEAAAKLGVPTYAQVKDGKVTFGKNPTAYSGLDYSKILAGYAAPAAAKAEPPKPEAKPEVKAAPPGVKDSDNDGIPDDKDKCPGTPAHAKVDERGCWVLEQDYLFDFNKFDIKKQYYPILDDIVKVMNENPTMKVQLEGHTDSVGSDAYNQKLSERRANAVKDYLVKKGKIKADRLTTKGFGEKKPIADNKTKEGRAKNRRVELTPIWTK